MIHKLYKHKLLLDEGFPPRSYFPHVNQWFDVKHVKDDFKHIGLSDTEVYELAVQLKRLIVTYNAKDFRQIAHNSKESGVIGVSPFMPYDRIDKRLTSLLIKSTHKALFGKYTVLREET
jgi:Domain of unknown function (DUF5615)